MDRTVLSHLDRAPEVRPNPGRCRSSQARPLAYTGEADRDESLQVGDKDSGVP